jgi:hypothetical protein
MHSIQYTFAAAEQLLKRDNKNALDGSIPMYRVRRERGDANGYILRAAFVRGAIPDPFAAMYDDCFTPSDIGKPTIVLHAEDPLQNERILIEVRPLSGLTPSRGALHSRNTHSECRCVHAADEFLDQLTWAARRADDLRCMYVCGHKSLLTAK